MIKKKFRITWQISLVIFFVLAVIATQGMGVIAAYKTNQAKPAATEPDFPNVTANDLYFEIDAENKVFNSRQVISLVNSPTGRREICFLIHPDLTLDQVEFTTAQGSPITVTGWRYDTPVEYQRWYGTVVLSKVIVQLGAEIVPNQVFTMHLAYHLKSEKFQTNLGSNFYQLFVSPQSQRAVGFDSGAFPVIEADGAAPFKITIVHPEAQMCIVPGDRISEEVSQGFATTSYQVSQPYDPAFSCAAYRKEQKSLNGITVEFYLIPGQPYSEKMGEIALKNLALYSQLFGDPGLNFFRFVFVPVEGESGGSESKGNTVYLGQSKDFENFDQDAAEQQVFITQVAHEGFHNWNAFYARWSGKLSGWWTEGGANFMSAWAGEKLWGESYGRTLRSQYVESFDREMGYFSSGTLENPNDFSKSNSWKGEWTLTYDYGALVWEQLRQKIGDQALVAGLRAFFQESAGKSGSYEDWIECTQRFTEVDVAAYLTPWTSHNARVDYVMKQVTVKPTASQYETTVVLEVVEDRDIELFSSIGFKTASSSDWELIPLHTTQAGTQVVKFTSQEKPVAVLLDPEFRVPQTNLTNDIWPWTK